MLDFYSTEDLCPFPEDLPVDRQPIGSMSLREFESCRASASPCFEAADVADFSFFSDWIVPAEAQAAIVACLESQLSTIEDESRQGLEILRRILSRSAGANVLAVCD